MITLDSAVFCCKVLLVWSVDVASSCVVSPGKDMGIHEAQWNTLFIIS